MAHISRGLIQKFRYFKGGTAGLFITPNGTQTQYRVLSSLFPPCSGLSDKHSQDHSREDYKTTKKMILHKKINAFKVVHLNTLSKSNITEAEVLNIMNKLLTAYEAMELNQNFKRQLQDFSNSEEFLMFCALLESQIHKFSLKVLLRLYELEHFNVPQTSSLMVKISNLVLGKFKNVSLYEKLLIYGLTLRKPCEEMNRKNILEECETYVKKGLVYDLNSKKTSSELSLILSIKGLPKDVKLILVEKLQNDILSGKIIKKVAVNSLVKLSTENDYLLPKQCWLDLIQFCLKTYSAFPLIRVICSKYLRLLINDPSYYRPELIELMVNKISRENSGVIQFELGAGLCAGVGSFASHAPRIKKKEFYFSKSNSRIGYFSEKLLNELISDIFSLFKILKGDSLVHVLSFLAQTSFHEVVTESVAQQIRNLLETKEIFDNVLNLRYNSLLCMYLTYIGCDTRVLLSSIFKRADNKTENIDSNLLTLHHLARAYFPGEYESLSEETVNRLVKGEFREASLLDPENSIGKCFESEDFMLRNCITSDRHCLHFVTVFQSDRKPMNLASYSDRSGPENFFNVDTIEKPPGSKMITFILFPYKQPVKFLNLPSMTGSAKMFLKSFQNVSCDIVLLHKAFFSLSLEDKKKFLKSQIDEIFEKSGN